MIENKALLVIGLKENQIDLDKINDIESFVEEFLIDSDPWCGGEHVYGYVVCKANEGQVIPCLIDEMFQRMSDLETMLENRLQKYGVDEVTLADINIYLISRVD